MFYLCCVSLSSSFLPLTKVKMGIGRDTVVLVVPDLIELTFTSPVI